MSANPPSRPLNRAALALVAALALACASDERAREASAPRSASVPAPVPWPDTFQRECVLAATRIEVVGPIGLLDHIAIRQDSINHEHLEAVTAEGLRIEERQKPDSDLSPIRAQLDALVLVADESLVVIESPTARTVIVQGFGDAFLRSVDSGEERRAQTLRLEGGP